MDYNKQLSTKIISKKDGLLIRLSDAIATQYDAVSCCGVLEFADIAEDDEDIVYNSGTIYSVTEWTQLLKKTFEEAKPNWGMITCYLLPCQLKTSFGKALLKTFKVSGKFYNPGTGNTLTHLTKVLNRSKPKVKKSKRKSFRG